MRPARTDLTNPGPAYPHQIPKTPESLRPQHQTAASRFGDGIASTGGQDGQGDRGGEQAQRVRTVHVDVGRMEVREELQKVSAEPVTRIHAAA